MNKLIQMITLDGQKFQAIEEPGYDCAGCCFEHSREGCKKANAIFPCSIADTEYIFKPYDGLITKQIQETNKQDNQDKQDSIVAEIRELLLQRSQTGISKYGTTLDRKDLKPSEWCQHLLEELLDASGYVLRLKKDLEAIEKITKGTA